MNEKDRSTPDEVVDEVMNKPLDKHSCVKNLPGVEHTLFQIKDQPEVFRRKQASWETESILTQRRKRRR